MLLQAIQTANLQKVAIIGLAKHVGKTTALNQIIEQAQAAKTSLSLLSMGVDGERFDALIGVPKPAIYAPAGTLLATAANALEQATARLELMEATGIPSALGEVWIARVAEAGTVLLAGVRQVADARFLLERFTKMGTQLHLIDGAFDRMASATTELADGVIVATGASVGRTVQEVAAATRFVLAKLGLALVTEQWEQAVARLLRASGRIAAGGPDLEPVLLQTSNPLLQHPLTDPKWPQAATVLALPGAVTDRVLDSLQGTVQTLIIPNGTHVLATPGGWRRFERTGGQIKVAQPIRVVAVTVNPFSAEGYHLPRQELLAAVQRAAGNLPVIDCLQREA